MPDARRVLSAAMAYVASVLERWARRLFRERDLLLRSDGKVHFVRLTAKLQMSLALLAVAALLWVGGATYTAWDQRIVIRSGVDELHELKAAYRDLLGEAQGYHEKVAALTQRFATGQGELQKQSVQLIQSDEATASDSNENEFTQQLRRLDVDVGEMTRMSALIAESLTKIEADFARVDAEGESAVQLRTLLRDRLCEVEDRLIRTQTVLAIKERKVASLEKSLNLSSNSLAALEESHTELKSVIASVELEREAERKRGDELTAELVRMSDALLAVRNKHVGALRQRTASETRMAALENLLGASRTQSQRLEAQLTEVLAQLAKQAGEMEDGQDLALLLVSERVARLIERLEEVYTSQEATLARYSQRAVDGLGDLERIIEMAGLDAKILMSRVEYVPTGQGGLFIAAPAGQRINSGMVSSEREGLADALLNLETHLSQWETLREILYALPLVAPVDNYHVASGFGIRKDPLTKRRSMHFGADLAGWIRSPVYATAPGTVVVVGRKARFGKMVEIDHGYGIRTRYGHFSKILVKKGQVIEFRHKIGLLGNTGRSTGPHVHYEILFDKKQIDPLKFIKAGRYVSKV